MECINIYASLKMQECLFLIYFLYCVPEQSLLLHPWFEFVRGQTVISAVTTETKLSEYIVSLHREMVGRGPALFELPHSFSRSENIPSQSSDIEQNSVCLVHKL